MEGNRNNNADIDIIDLITKLLIHKKIIIGSCLVGAILGLLIGFTTPKKYQARIMFAPETEQHVGSGVSSIATMMGVTLNNSVDAVGVEMFPDILSSTPFISDLFDLPIETADASLKTDLLDYMLNHHKKSLITRVLNAPFKLINLIFSSKNEGGELMEEHLDIRNLPYEVRSIIGYFRENINISTDKNTGKITISIVMQDPLVAATVLDQIVENLKEYISNYRTSKARQDVENLAKICEERRQEYYLAQQIYADFMDSNRGLALHSTQVQQQKLQQEMNLAYQVFSQVSTQLEGARIKEQQSKPVLYTLEPIAVPASPMGPGKIKLLVIFAFLAGCFASAWVLFIKDYFRKIKEQL